MPSNQTITIYSGSSEVKTYEVPYQLKVYYTLATTNESLTLRCSIGVFDTYDNSVITEEYLKGVQELIKSNTDVSVEYKFNNKTVCKLTVDKNTYVAYKTKLGEGETLIEDLEIQNYFN